PAPKTREDVLRKHVASKNCEAHDQQDGDRDKSTGGWCEKRLAWAAQADVQACQDHQDRNWQGKAHERGLRHWTPPFEGCQQICRLSATGKIRFKPRSSPSPRGR